jgi:RNA polymerase sigma-70 factor, ECF subfamily
MSVPATIAAWSQARIPSDEEVARRVVEGEVALFEVLMRRNNQRLYRAIRSIVQTDSEVEDVMQQAYLAAFGALPGFKHSSKFSTWLVRIGLNEAFAARRRASRFEALPASESSEGEPVELPVSGQVTPEDSASSRELGQILERVLDRIPQTFRTVIVLREVEGLTTAETAEALGVSEDLVKTRLHRAKTLVRDTLYAWTERQPDAPFQFHASRCDRVVAAVLGQILAPSSAGRF